VQIVDDTQAKTLASSSSYKLKGTKIEQAEMLGGQIAEIAKKSKIKRVVFDRGGNKFHGRIKALAEAARKAGLEF
jgi:large subunit ribosomal protein L18